MSEAASSNGRTSAFDAENVGSTPAAVANLFHEPCFIGYYTIYGPHGYVQSLSRSDVDAAVERLLAKWPHAQSAAPYQELFSRLWRATVWSKIELAGN